ncbi:MAG: hypothetical protein KDD47_24885, partial [Acidobacteria bacterium]|nr:hypothetical protein [Acidobacteriota bacterium]
MKAYRLSMIAIALLFSWGGAPASSQEPELEAMLAFETGGETLLGWGGGPAGTLHLDTVTVHGGKGAARLERDGASPGGFTSLTGRLPIDFAGRTLELHGFLHTVGVTGFAGLWMREDGPGGSLQFDNMNDQGLRGTTPWKEYTVRLPLHPKARELYFGVLVAGAGTVWADDLRLLVDGKPIAQAPKRVVQETVLEKDQEFDGGSGITVAALTPAQVEHLAVLGRVWGFLKYHHPRVASGELHWDYELFRVLPEVLGAADAEERNRALSRWLEKVGLPEACDPCATAPENAHLLPRLDWIRDEAQLGSKLSHKLRVVHANRFQGSEQFYVSKVPGVGNPVFDRELDYADRLPPDAGYRLLALMRLWNIAEYWFPYRDQIDDDWVGVLRELLPRFVAAGDWDGYRLELLALIARLRDTHANLWSALDVRPPRGDCYLPLELRFVEGRLTVAAFTDEEAGRASGMAVGDVIEALDGRPVDAWIEELSPYYAASNETTRLRDIAWFLGRGPCGKSKLSLLRGEVPRTAEVPRLEGRPPRVSPRDRPGETFQLLSPEVAYLKLSSIRAQDVAGYLDRAAKTRGLVIDLRGYPSEFMVFTLGRRLVEKPTPFARFTEGDLDNPGAFTWTQPLVLEPQAPTYRGRVAILVNEVSISQAEYTAMALRAGPRAVVVGGTTAGADGNVSRIPLPGGLYTQI